MATVRDTINIILASQKVGKTVELNDKALFKTKIADEMKYNGQIVDVIGFKKGKDIFCDRYIVRFNDGTINDNIMCSELNFDLTRVKNKNKNIERQDTMSYELIKGMTYQNGKVYTRQCSNNIIPKTYFREEHLGFTKQYNELGQVGFEKWFIINCLMTGSYKVQNGSNNILRRLNYFSNLLWKDKEYLKLYNCQNEKFDKTLSAKTPEEKETANKEYKKSMEDIEKYISFFYDSHNSRYRNIEMER